VSRFRIGTALIAAHWRHHRLRGQRLAEWQEQRAIALVREVRSTSAFYGALWRDHADEAWRSFPTVNKAAMMQAFDTFNTAGVTRDAAMAVAVSAEQQRNFQSTVGGLTVGLSSGTSGHRGVFLVSHEEQLRWAGTILARAVRPLRPGLRAAFFLRANSRLYEQTASLVRFEFFDLFAPIEQAVSRLNALAPHVIVAPPSMLGLLADAHARGVLRVTPRQLISVAEVLEPQDRERLQAVFQVQVDEVYQCTEGLIAVTCARGSLHVQEDVMVMQPTPLIAARTSAPNRVTPILTDLWRRTQPIVRYALDDVLTLGHRACSCGSDWQCIDAIDGRHDDLCAFPDASGALRTIFPDAIRRMLLLADPRIREYHAEQPVPGALMVHVALDSTQEFETVRRNVITRVTADLAQYQCVATQLDVALGVPPVAPGAKRRRIIAPWRRPATNETARDQ
jgi:putative adenylate-forming enzyme